jgi:hypothetical protein
MPCCQVTSIFAEFSIDWPPEMLQILDVLNIFRVEIDAVSPECLGTTTWFQIWLLMVLLPFILLVCMGSAAVSLQVTA